MIQNYLCETCEHYYVCKKIDAIRIFDKNDPRYIGVTIEMAGCIDYLEVTDD